MTPEDINISGEETRHTFIATKMKGQCSHVMDLAAEEPMALIVICCHAAFSYIALDSPSTSIILAC